ncbi:MAG: hypothetical protein ACOH2K_15720 [Burkholderiaceae bacterium]
MHAQIGIKQLGSVVLGQLIYRSSLQNIAVYSDCGRYKRCSCFGKAPAQARQSGACIIKYFNA